MFSFRRIDKVRTSIAINSRPKAESAVAAVQVPGQRVRCWGESYHNFTGSVPRRRRPAKVSEHLIKVKRDPCFGSKMTGKAPLHERKKSENFLPRLLPNA